MEAWIDRDYRFLDWQELVPYVGRTVTVTYRRWRHFHGQGPYLPSDYTDEMCTGVLQAVDHEAVTVNGECLPYRGRYDGSIDRDILTIRLGDEAALAREEAYFAWERSGRPWLTKAEQDRMYFQALEWVRRQQEPSSGGG